LRNTILSRARLPIPPHRQIMAGVVGIEPTPKVLETFVLPLNYTPIYGGGGRIRTAEP
jgi:hypothetical protein